MNTWVDFKELRSKLRFAEVLKDYHADLKIKGDRATGFCPLPAHQSRHSGKRKSPSFSANLAKGIFQCFGCGARGNALDFAALMEGVDPHDAQALRQVALKLQERFGLGDKPSPPAKPAKVEPAAQAPKPTVEPAQENAERGDARPAIVNAPLDFELKGLDPNHPYLKGRGFTPETIEHFGLGYCGRGLMQGRIAIPLHDAAGKLIGYAGRLVDDSAVDEQHPKYLFPSAREREGKSYEFRKGLFLFNGFRAGTGLADLIVVEGFMSVFWLHQNGYPHVVALMGASASPEQVELIIEMARRDGRVWIFTDGDAAGHRCALDLLAALTPYRFCRWLKLGKGQPTDCTAEELAGVLSEFSTRLAST